MPTNLMTLSDGALVVTRIRGLYKTEVIREDFCRAYRHIKTGRQLRSTLRHGPYAWPGGYPMYFVAADGEALCFDCARKNFREVVGAVRGSDVGWRVIGVDINYEDDDLHCVHCNEKIPAAYR